MASKEEAQPIEVGQRIKFDEQTMRKFGSLEEALKAFDKVQSTRKIVRLYQSTFAIRVGNVSLNVSSLDKSDEATREKLIARLFGKNKNSQQLLLAEVDKWRKKFEPIKDTESDIKTPIKQPIAADNLVKSDEIADKTANA